MSYGMGMGMGMGGMGVRTSHTARFDARASAFLKDDGSVLSLRCACPRFHAARARADTARPAYSLALPSLLTASPPHHLTAHHLVNLTCSNLT